jgi:hypothetical protein
MTTVTPAVAAAAERLHRQSFVLDLHTHGPGFVPQPFRTVWRGVTIRAPGEVGFDVLRKAGVDAVVAKAVGDPIVTRWYVGRSPWDAVEAQLVLIERQAGDAGALVAGSRVWCRPGRRACLRWCSAWKAPTRWAVTSIASMPGTSVASA